MLKNVLLNTFKIVNVHSYNLIYKAVLSNADQIAFWNLRTLVDNYSSNWTHKKNVCVENFRLYYTIKTQKCKWIQEAVLQKDNDTFINVSNPNDV